MKGKGSCQAKFTLPGLVHMCADDQSHQLIIQNAKEQRGGKGGQEKERETGRQRKQDRSTEMETMIRKEEKRKEEVLLIYTLKSSWILDGSTQLNIDCKEAIYSIFCIFLLTSPVCVCES